MLVLVVGDVWFPPNLARLQDLSTVVSDRTGRPLRIFLNREDTWRLSSDLSEVPTEFITLLLAYEDQRFFYHPGVDLIAVVRALFQNASAWRVKSGASTLTMQVARMLTPRSRTLPSKIIEMIRAVQLEVHFSKREILNMYLSLAPYGGNVSGIRAGAWILFGKTPNELTLGESALLVALPRSPSRLRPDRQPKRAQEARNQVLARAAVPSEAILEANRENIPTHRHRMPSVAAHLAHTLQKKSSPIIQTTLDGSLQRAVEDLARKQLPDLQERAGMAILVVENRTRKVRAYLGAPEFFNEQRSGYIDMVRTPRSPGSALKPFIYGMAFDTGILHPETRLSDVSTHFGDYAPRNFDREFHGELTAREALQRSLNVPAVLILDKIGPLRFAQALQQVGVHLVLPRGTLRPGLPIALGGASLSLWDLTMLYVGLARDGKVGSFQIVQEATLGQEFQWMRPGTAHQVLRILEGSLPPPGVVQANEIRQRSPIALKTGTSFGFRDAWAFGVNTQYTVGVWTGRPDGTPVPDHYGRTTAAPLLYQVFDLLPEEPTNVSIPNSEPPALLNRLSSGNADPAPDPLRLLFPISNLVLETQPQEPILLSAAGGKRPLFWLVNNQPFAVSAIHREVNWIPDGPGFSRITVIDSEGRSANVSVEIR
ncbi:penicillin-binding protein 1C [Gammaproteobacteria bacterium]